MMRQIHLHGSLATVFGPVYQMDVQTPVEAVRALSVQLPGFLERIRGGAYRVVRGEVDLDPMGLRLQMGHQRDLHIIPVPHGAKSNSGVGKVILGVVIIAVAWYAAPAAAAGGGAAWGASTGFLGVTYGGVAMLGLSIALSGVAMMLTPVPTVGDYGDREEGKSSFLFNGPVNRTEQGGAVPLVYGQVMAGSIVVSTGLTSENAPINNFPLTSWGLDYDGVDDHIDFGTPAHLVLDPPLLVEVWVIPATLTAGSTGDPIVSYGSPGNGGWCLQIEDSGATLNLVRHGIADQRVTLDVPLVVDRAYHIMMYQHADIVEAWVDGQLQLLTADTGLDTTIAATTDPLYVGRCGSRYFHGLIDDVRLARGFHADDEISDLADRHADSRADTDIPNHTEAWWRFNEGTGVVTADILGLAPGTLVGGTKWIVPAFRREGGDWEDWVRTS